MIEKMAHILGKPYELLLILRVLIIFIVWLTIMSQSYNLDEQHRKIVSKSRGILKSDKDVEPNGIFLISNDEENESNDNRENSYRNTNDTLVSERNNTEVASVKEKVKQEQEIHRPKETENIKREIFNDNEEAENSISVKEEEGKGIKEEESLRQEIEQEENNSLTIEQVERLLDVELYILPDMDKVIIQHSLDTGSTAIKDLCQNKENINRNEFLNEIDEFMNDIIAECNGKLRVVNKFLTSYKEYEADIPISVKQDYGNTSKFPMDFSSIMKEILGHLLSITKALHKCKDTLEELFEDNLRSNKNYRCVAADIYPMKDISGQQRIYYHVFNEYMKNACNHNTDHILCLFRVSAVFIFVEKQFSTIKLREPDFDSIASLRDILTYLKTIHVPNINW